MRAIALFAIFMNDLPAALKFTKYLIYADDCQIYKHCDPHKIIDGIIAAEQDAQALADWALVNGLEPNISKIKVMIVGSDAYINRLKNQQLPENKINGTAIPYSYSVKNLGVTISSNLQ